ncbi:MAG TPA: TGS domain-containing protein, partial [Bacteroidia bacterium]|nr:TGS domain-containing protein [Bacteroidia bacterium]
MIKITLPDGSVREYENGTTSMQVAQSISEGLARNVLAAKINNEVWDAGRPIHTDVNLSLLTWNDELGKETMWHSSAHIMAEALEALYPGVQFWVGPPLENGFYYDVDLNGQTLTPADFEKIEQKMLELARQNNTFTRKEISKADAI